MKTLVALVVLAVVGGTSAFLIHQYGGWSTLTGKSWAITYEVTAEPAAGTPMQVEYLSNADRYKKEAPHVISKATTLPFKAQVIINAGEKAGVSATPNGDQVLTCRVLLDDEKVLATVTGTPGKKVDCETTTGS